MKGKSMLKVELMVLCDYASISKEGKLSINGIFDEVRILKLPGGLARAFLVATIHGVPNESYKLTLKMQYKGEDILPPNNITTAPAGLNGKNNILVELTGISFPKEGEYEIKMYHGDDELGFINIKAIHMKQEQAFKMPN